MIGKYIQCMDIIAAVAIGCRGLYYTAIVRDSAPLQPQASQMSPGHPRKLIVRQIVPCKIPLHKDVLAMAVHIVPVNECSCTSLFTVHCMHECNNIM